jgi:putative ABC transport system ATP-binding protein
MIRLENIERHFSVGDQPVHALRGVSLDIGAGDYISIMGPSGSGKSTLLHILGLLDRPDSGRYLFQGQDTTSLSEQQQTRLRRDKIGFVFQFFHLIPRLTAFDNIALPLTLAGIEPAERQRRVHAALAAYGLSDRAHHRPDQLSGGQRQRVAIGRATIMQPPLLLADEPTGNLDRASGHEVVAILEKLVDEGVTVVVVTHDPELGKRARRHFHMLDGGMDG